MGVPIVLTLFTSGLVGFLIGRWWAVAVPIGGLTLFYVGLGVGWWGYGLGEAWQVAMLVLMLVGVLGAVVGIAARTLMRPPAARPRQRTGEARLTRRMAARR